MSDRPAKKRSTKKKELDPLLQAQRLMEQFDDPLDESQVHTRDIAVRVATAWALISIADSLARSNEKAS